MDASMNKGCVIPPFLGDIIWGLFFLLGGTFLIEFSNQKELNVEWGYYAYITIGILLTFLSLRHYSVDTYGITIRYLWLPIYCIPWKDVSTAEYITKWNIGDVFGKTSAWGNREGYAIIVSLKLCPPFCAEIESLHLFLMQHPIHAHFIRFSKKNHAKFVNAFLQFYPSLTTQLGSSFPPN